MVVGGGEVASRKVRTLLQSGAEVMVIAPEVSSELAASEVELHHRPYRDGDLAGAHLAFTATDSREVNAAVAREAGERGVPINVADRPSEGDFALPSTLRRGKLQVAVSTGGASPALAKRIKREIAEQFGEPYARLAVMLNDARGWAKGTLPTYQDRKAFFESIVNGEPDPIELLRAGDERAVLDLIAAAQRTHQPA